MRYTAFCRLPLFSLTCFFASPPPYLTIVVISISFFRFFRFSRFFFIRSLRDARFSWVTKAHEINGRHNPRRLERACENKRVQILFGIVAWMEKVAVGSRDMWKGRDTTRTCIYVLSPPSIERHIKLEHFGNFGTVSRIVDMLRLAVTRGRYFPPSKDHQRSAVHDVLAQKTFAGPCRH